MSQLVELISKVSTVKQNIKEAIVNKGVEVSDTTPFGDYPSKISAINSSKNQDLTIRKDGVYQAITGEHTYYSLSCGFESPFNEFWIEGNTPSIGDSAYKSKYVDETQTETMPDVSNVIGTVSGMWQDGDYNYISITTYPGYGWNLTQASKTYTITFDYTGLGTVTVNATEGFVSGDGIPTEINYNVSKVRDYCFLGCNVNSVSLPNCTTMGEQCFSSCVSLASVSLPEYLGATLNEETGYRENWGSGYCFAYDNALTSFYAPKCQILSWNFFENINFDESVVFNFDNLIGIAGNAFGNTWDRENVVTTYQMLKRLNKSLTSMKYLSYCGGLLEDYISDTDNNITDTLNLPNLITIGQWFCMNTYSTYLNNITNLLVPSVKRIEDYAQVSFANITSLDLPSISSIGNEALSGCSNLKTINIGSNITYIASNAFSDLSDVTINIDKEEGSIEGAPWGASNATVNWK